MTETLDAAALSELLEAAIARHRAFDFDEAERLYRAVLAAEPGHADALHNLGVLLAIQLGRPGQSLPHLEAALNADPLRPQFWFSYIDALIRAGQPAMAEQLLPVAQAHGLPRTQVQALTERLARTPMPVAQVAVPVVATESETAAAMADPSAEVGGPMPVAEQRALVALFDQRDYVRGEARARVLLERYPDEGFLWKALGSMLQSQGRKLEALEAKQRAAALSPNDAEALCNLGRAHFEMEQRGPAIAALRAAIAIRPDHAEAFNNLGLALNADGEVAQAAGCFERAVAIQPGFAEALNNLSGIYVTQGQIDAAVDVLSRAVAAKPNYRVAFDNLLFAMNYHPDASAETIYEAYAAYDQAFGAPQRAHWQAHTNLPAAGRRLRVGYVSPDFRLHACSFFMDPLLAGHDRQAFEVYAYAELRDEGDGVTQRTRALVDHWVLTHGLSDQALAERIRADGIDILVDLAGHTKGNRLDAFALKPAPVSLSWMGFGYTTGLSAIDYYLTDEANAPAGCEHLFAEIPWRLPDTPFAVYRPGPGMGAVGSSPAQRTQCITFGTLTRGIRINDHTIRAWSQILQRVPQSRLVIDSRSFVDPAFADALAERFASCGIERARLQIGCHSPPWDLLREIDIGLDCFPHNSGTTLFEMLYMGVPVVTLAGRPSVGRIGSAILQGLGRPDWIAHTEAEYVDKVVTLAQDIPALAALRAGLRAQMVASPLMDERRFVQAVEAAFREMFARWSAAQGQPQAPAAGAQIDADLAELQAELLYNEGNNLHAQGRTAEAEARWLAALTLCPNHADVHNNLGMLQQEQGRPEEAEASYRAALQARPDHALAHHNLGNVLQHLGELGEAVACYQRALSLGLDSPHLFDNLLFLLNYEPDLDAATIFAAYEDYDRRFGRPHQKSWRPHANARDSRRRLKVGYVSPDFRQHACSLFLEPLLAAHDKRAVEVWAYAELSRDDDTTRRYQGHVDHWVATHGMSDGAMAERIRADGIDVLVDVAGHTVGNRLGVFARKPAPVSLSWLGFGTTTGLRAIDYYLADATSVPFGSEAVFSEEPWRLPVGWVYRPAPGMGEVGPLPAQRRGSVTFGTLSRSIRINQHTVRVWSQILVQVPGSRLVIDSRNFTEAQTCERVLARFAEQGIAADRLAIGCHSPPWDVLRDIDIGLDCFPHNSGTTLFEMLYMGLPVVTLAARPSVGRIGSAILQGLGRAEWIAATEAEYVRKVVALAQDLPALAALRASLRPQMQASPLMDEAGFARSVEQAYRAMFQRFDERTAPYAEPAATEPSPQDAETLARLFRERRLPEGEQLARELSQRFPDSGFVWKALGVMLQAQGKSEEALRAKRRAADLRPDDAEVFCNLGHALQDTGRFAEAEQVLARALVLRPNYLEAFNNLAITYQKQGRLDESLANFERALALQPGHEDIYGNFLFTLNYHPDRGADEIFGAYREYDRRFGQPHRGAWKRYANPRSAQRRLKVGYVSPDFREHAVARFLEPLLAAHDKGAVEVWAYADLGRADAVSARYEGHVDHWVATRQLDDAALADRIRADGIDVLVDVAGHTVGNRLGVFARKPAPVSLSWLGFGYTTGLTAVDYYLTDAASAPAGSEALFSETPWRLPVSWVYRPADGMGEVGPLPALHNGCITLGTLTRSVRINHHTLRVWSQILHRLPQARLVIDSRSYADASAQQALVAQFETLGIAADRLAIGFHSPPWDVLRGIDIALDCFPHNSGTTLFESLYMGVPFVTLAARPSVGRLGSAVLHGLGHPEWVAEDEAGYIARVLELAQDLPRLAELRAGLRQQMATSALMDEAGFARQVERAYEQMFAQWCQGDADPVVALVQRAQALYHRGNVEHDEGQLDQAVASLRQAVQLVPELAEAHTNLGLVLQQQGQLAEAEACYRASLAQRPECALVHYNLGTNLRAQGRPAEAERAFRDALALDATLRPAQVLLDRVMQEQGLWIESEVYWRDAVRDRPEQSDGYLQLAAVLRRQNRHAEAIACLQHALQVVPEKAALHQHLSTAYREQRRYAEAEQSCRRALELDPDSALAWNNLASVWNAMQRLEEAESGFRKALALDHQLAPAYGNLGIVLQNQGRQQEAEAAMRQGLALQPDDMTGHGNLLFVLNYHPDKTAEQVFDEYRLHDQMFYAAHRRDWRPHANTSARGRPLKIGYVSPDFRHHSCAYFVEPLLARHDHSAVTVYAYAELQQEDSASTRYRSLVDYWVPTLGLSDAALAERIRADGIDILVDIAGHTAGNRLGVFARKPAPVSVSWLGYGTTTGLSAIDYYLTDAQHVPAGSERYFSETPWRLPVGWVYRPPALSQTGEPGLSPAQRNGHVTFGTLTRAVRVNDATVRVWSELLHRVPGSRLVVDSRSYQDDRTQQALARRFAAHGIAVERLSIGCSSSGWEPLRGIDISLDCFPHNSGTTLFESLYMGVPFVTLVGQAGVGSLGDAILQGIGHPEWVAHSEQAYLDKAVALAMDVPRLVALRAGLRAQMQASPLMDEIGYARAVEDAYRQMFARWEQDNKEKTP